MKTKRLIGAAIAAASILSGMKASAQEDAGVKGWNFGPLPCVSYNSDLGFQYGACADIFYYGDGSVFPDYLHRFYVEASTYTGGQSLLHAQYDSKYLIPGVRVTGAVSWQYDPLYYFYGFNGSEAFDPALNLNPATGEARYNCQRSMLRILLDLQGTLAGRLNWVAGTSFWGFGIQDFESKKYDPATSLYHQWVAEGKIDASQAAGGMRLEMKAGLVYDTRNLEAAPSRGIWAEAYINGSPDLFGASGKGVWGGGYLKLAAHWRQYLPLVSDRLVLAYHLAYQGTLAGETPFYMLPVIYTLYLRQTGSEGLGGLNTVRGLIQNRLVGEGYAWANVELRWKLFEFKFIGQNWYLATNPFVDAGYVLQPYRPQVFGVGSERFDVSAGLGLKLAMNENFIVSVEAAQVLGHSEYPMGLVIALNYIF